MIPKFAGSAEILMTVTDIFPFQIQQAQRIENPSTLDQFGALNRRIIGCSQKNDKWAKNHKKWLFPLTWAPIQRSKWVQDQQIFNFFDLLDLKLKTLNGIKISAFLANCSRILYIKQSRQNHYFFKLILRERTDCSKRGLKLKLATFRTWWWGWKWMKCWHLCLRKGFRAQKWPKNSKKLNFSFAVTFYGKAPQAPKLGCREEVLELWTFIKVKLSLRLLKRICQLAPLITEEKDNQVDEHMESMVMTSDDKSMQKCLSQLQ